ncbi:MAG: hypothetical protein ABIJ45_06885 [Candidatus Zixiibacteriota bacterium]
MNMNPEYDPEFKVPIKVYILYFAFLIAPIFYLYMAYLVSRGSSPVENGGNETIQMIFPVISFAAALGGIIYRRLFMRRFPIILSKDTFDEDFRKNIISPIIIYLAFFESISIYGLVSFLMGGAYLYLIIYALVSMSLMILHFPNRQLILEMYEQQKGLGEQGKIYE